jgi:poly(3-hydroxybutyrate) depolymerase
MAVSLHLATVITVALLLFRSVTAIPSPGCETAKYNPITDHYVSGQGNGRNLHLAMPRRYHPRRPAPLVIAFHDRDQLPEEFMLESLMSNQFVNDEAIVVYPTGLKVSELLQYLSKNLRNTEDQTGDMGFRSESCSDEPVS